MQEQTEPTVTTQAAPDVAAPEAAPPTAPVIEITSIQQSPPPSTPQPEISAGAQPLGAEGIAELFASVPRPPLVLLNLSGEPLAPGTQVRASVHSGTKDKPEVLVHRHEKLEAKGMLVTVVHPLDQSGIQYAVTL